MSEMTALFPNEASDLLCEALPYLIDARKYIMEARENVVEAQVRGHVASRDDVKDLLKEMDLAVTTLNYVMNTITSWNLNVDVGHAIHSELHAMGLSDEDIESLTLTLEDQSGKPRKGEAWKKAVKEAYARVHGEGSEDRAFDCQWEVPGDDIPIIMEPPKDFQSHKNRGGCDL